MSWAVQVSVPSVNGVVVSTTDTPMGLTLEAFALVKLTDVDQTLP